MSENESPKPIEILQSILDALQSEEIETRLNAIARLHTINYSSEAICNKIENLALRDPDDSVRAQALAALDLATQRNIRSRMNTVDAKNRLLILREIEAWEKLNLLEKENADVIRRRYNFDAAPKPEVRIESAQLTQQNPPEAKSESAPESAPAQPTLTQTLLSETSVKIALYLGAFFVIAAAAILGAFVDIFRIPLLIIATIIFGGLSIAVRKRLPQPSFTLFIVFSFLLPITANVIEGTLNLSPPFSATYWVFVSTFMALIWAGSARLYQSRLFSVTAYISLVVAFYRVGDIFDAASEFYPAMLGLAALAGAFGAWALKQWKDENFARPLFLAAQALQAFTIFLSIGYLLFQFSGTPLWNLASVFTWGCAFLFYALSDFLFPFVFFPWFASATLIGIPWFIGAAFELRTSGETILFFVWGFILAAASEGVFRFEKTRKYSLPVLLASIVSACTALIYGFSRDTTAGFICALGVAILYAALHVIRPRGWLWAFALLNFAIAYFASFSLPFIQTANIFFGYTIFGISALFLLPDLFLDANSPKWITARIIPAITRIYGAALAAFALIIYITPETYRLEIAVMFGLYAIFFTAYTIVKRKAVYGYLPAAYLPLTIIFALNHFDIDAWLPALTGLAASYFLIGAGIRPQKDWSQMFRVSALTLGALISLGALIVAKEHGGWYALAVGLLFAAEALLSRNGWYEIGVPVMFNIGAFLILKDFNVDETAYILLAYSLVWLLTDAFAQLAFANPRPLKWV
ncbi:MAG: hypothetical protein PHQ36_12780, partial [Anaerolineales bacterium]|nr:hypothetical protein [Anaerolineales bacterium]